MNDDGAAHEVLWVMISTLIGAVAIIVVFLLIYWR